MTYNENVFDSLYLSMWDGVWLKAYLLEHVQLVTVRSVDRINPMVRMFKACSNLNWQYHDAFKLVAT